MLVLLNNIFGPSETTSNLSQTPHTVARYQPSDESNKHQMLENEEDEAPGVRCTDEQELSEMTNGTSKKPAHPTDSNRSSSSSEMNGEFRDVHASRFMTWLLKYDWLYRKCISLQDLRRELITFQLKKYPVGSSKVGALY